MEARAKILGHPIHQMLIPFPLGLLGTSIVFDVLYLILGGDQWGVVAFWMITAGVISGLVAAVFGLIDWLAIPRGTRARSVGAWHGIGNVVVIVLFSISWLLRLGAPEAPSILAILLAFVGVVLAVITGWLGGELIDRLGVGVDDGANLNAPSSLSNRPAGQTAEPRSVAVQR